MPSQDHAASSLTQACYERLRADVLACRLLPGARLKTAELCKALGANLSAVREALSRLTSDGLVVAEPQRGFRVAALSAAELTDLTSVRTQIEQLALRRAMEVGTLAWEAALVAAYHSLSRTPERADDDPQRMNEDWSAAHAAFHRALVAACDSPWLLRLRDMLYDQSERYRRLSVPLAKVARNLQQEHQALMDAALARAPDTACLLLANHLELTTRVLLKQCWPPGDPATPAPASKRHPLAGRLHRDRIRPPAI